MNWVFTLYITILFFILTPGILLTLPSTNSKRRTVALVHAGVFAVIFLLTCKYVWQMSTLHIIMPNLS